MALTAEDKRLLGLLAIAFAGGAAAYEASQHVGIRIDRVQYLAGPLAASSTSPRHQLVHARQALALVTITNHTDSASSFILRGYATRQDILNQVAPAPLGLSILETASRRLTKLLGTTAYAGTPGITYQGGLIETHWFSSNDVTFSSGQASSNARTEELISFSAPRGKTVTVPAYTATPFSSLAGTSGAIVNFWLILPPSEASGSVLKPVFVYLDPRPSMPPV